MTKGSPLIAFRIPRSLMADIDETIARRNKRTRDEPWDRSAFIRCAIRDKLHHMARSRRTTGRRSAGRAAQPANEV